MSTRGDSGVILIPPVLAALLGALSDRALMFYDATLVVVIALVCGLWARYRSDKRRIHRAMLWLPQVAFDRFGVEFPYKGDVVVWTWPWQRGACGRPWISLGFTGNGQFGDARYASLAELDRSWDEYFEVEMETRERPHQPLE